MDNSYKLETKDRTILTQFESPTMKTWNRPLVHNILREDK